MMRWMRSRPGSCEERVNWVLDADFRDYFSSLDHRWLERFLEHRIADRRVLRLIQKWFSAGVIEDGVVDGVRGGRSARGISFTAACERLPALRLRPVGSPVEDAGTRAAMWSIVRFADDFVVGFEHRDDAERFWADLRDRLAQFSPGAERREDAADRVRAVRRPEPQGAGTRQA